MSHAHDHDPTVPRGALVAAAILLLFTMALTGAVTSGLIPQSGDPDASRAAQHIMPAQERDLRFTDREDGAVVVTDAATGATVMEIGFGEGGFVRATMRRMAKVRAAADIGSEPPFKLTLWENGALSLSDPQTGKEAEIHGFGPDHSATFAAMLKDTRS
ncbi:photosynthetic complex assembly protein PuhC [Parasphingorhabdus sp.]|uniref:photosynthetic complex assembly protein PuhC n=1 Tax=Parasphingorhabdus sp. TaxID=2709688 RepID=UPI003A91A35B